MLNALRSPWETSITCTPRLHHRRHNSPSAAQMDMGPTRRYTWDQPGATLAQIAACAALTGAVPADKEGHGKCQTVSRSGSRVYENGGIERVLFSC